MSVLKPIENKPRRFDVLRESCGRPAPDRTRKLIQCYDQSEPATRGLHPVIQQALRGCFRQIGETIADCIVSQATHPPPPEGAVRVKIGIVPVFRKPEAQDLIRRNGSPIPRLQWVPRPKSVLGSVGSTLVLRVVDT